MMEMKIAMSMFVQEFDLELSESAPEGLPETLVTLRPKNGIEVSFKPVI